MVLYLGRCRNHRVLDEFRVSVQVPAQARELTAPCPFFLRGGGYGIFYMYKH